MDRTELRVREIIAVEGRYDKNTLARIVDADIIEINGFGIYRDADRLALIRRLARERSVIILTDSDGAGFQLRSYLKSALAGLDVKHAYVPDIHGREPRKRAAGKSGLLGVEGMEHDVIIKALRDAGATFGAEPPRAERGEITAADLYAWGLNGKHGARKRRAELLKSLKLPELLNTTGLLTVLNLLLTREETERLMDNGYFNYPCEKTGKRSGDYSRDDKHR